MTQVSTYLDHNATSPLRPGVLETMESALVVSGNPSSIHRQGRIARRLVEEARDSVAGIVGADASQVIFTSGGTEANHLAINGSVAECGIERLIVSAIEHLSCLESARASGVPVTEIAVNENGVINLACLNSELRANAGRALVALMWANNETGVVQPVAEVVDLAKSYGAVVMCDAVQGAGKLTLSIDDLGLDYLTLSAHKLGGPQGVGALVLGRKMQVKPVLRGGAQEMRRRAGTENVSGIVGFGKAVEQCVAKVAAESSPKLRDELEERVRTIAPDTIVIGAAAPRLPNTSCFALPGCKAETLVVALDLAGVSVSAGSACSSGKVGRSHVLTAMGVDDEVADAAIRVSTGWNSETADIDRFVNAWSDAVERMLVGGNEDAAADRASASE